MLARPTKTMKEYCIVCGKEIKGKKLEIGLCAETGQLTLNEAEATQGWFRIGPDCLRQWKKQQINRCCKSG